METLADIDYLLSFPNEAKNGDKLHYIYALLDAFNSPAIKNDLVKNSTTISIDNEILNSFCFILSSDADIRIRSLNGVGQQLELLSSEVKAIPPNLISMEQIEDVLQHLKPVIESKELYSKINQIKYPNPK